MNRKIGLLLAAAAAYGYYKYSKMSAEEKSNLMAKGKDFVNKNLGGLDELLGKVKPTAGPGNSGYYRDGWKLKRDCESDLFFLLKAIHFTGARKENPPGNCKKGYKNLIFAHHFQVSCSNDDLFRLPRRI